jgi:hypothetical protein
MLVRPRDLADRMSSTHQPTKFTLPIEAARLKVREILSRFPQAGYAAVVENGGSFLTVRLNSRCDIYRLQTDRRRAARRPQEIATHHSSACTGSRLQVTAERVAQ